MLKKFKTIGDFFEYDINATKLYIRVIKSAEDILKFSKTNEKKVKKWRKKKLKQFGFPSCYESYMEMLNKQLTKRS